MLSSPSRTIACLCGLLVTGCAGVTQKPWVQDAEQTSTQAVTVAAKAASAAATVAAAQASAAYQRMQHYLAEKDLLKTFTDAGEHSETEVLAVLHRASAKSAPGAPGAPGARGAAGAHGPAAVAQGSAPKLPAQYAGRLRWPLDAGVVSSEFGARWGKLHKGIDIAADSGEPVYAVADGDVIYAGNGLRGYGNVVIVQHDGHMSSLYAHNSALKVKQGDRVTQGMLLALLGSTGHSTGPHVHFEIREGDTAVNPRSVLPASKLADAGGQIAVEAPQLLARY
jgi:murein DD-endopeptidase MepM/ murein hydrolase activator NlpD